MFVGSVRNNLSEMSEFALKDMLRKNHHSTFHNSADKIEINRCIEKTIAETDEFRINKVTDTDWAFFMIPDRYMKLISNFNFYYQEDITDNKWVEVTDTEAISRQFTIQDNGVRYYIIAMRMNGNYAIKFAKTKQTSTITDPIIDDPTQPTDPTPTPGTWKGTITLNVTGDTSNKTFAYKKVEGGEAAIDITLDSMGSATITGLPEGVKFELLSVEGDVSKTYCYFAVYQDTDGSTKLRKSDTNESELTDVDGTVISITI